ncbi:MAG TPA: hypothetical protein GX708_11590 [Gallicola sp.]|nr:hypothetical protein [Gallicola sp.]
MKEYFYEKDESGKYFFEIPKVRDAYEWEEKQLIPTLQAYDIFGTGMKESTCSYFDKGSEELQFIRNVINEYGSISFGDTLTIGIVKMTEEEFNNLPEV